MKLKRVFINTTDGKRELLNDGNAWRDAHASVFVSIIEKSEKRAYKIKAQSDANLNKFCALELYFEADENAQFCSNYRHSEFWCKPAFCENATEIPENTQCLFAKSGEKYRCIFPTCGDRFLSAIKGTEDGDICVYMYSLCESVRDIDEVAFVEGIGDTPYILASECAEFALSCMGRDIPLRDGREYPEIFEYLGWCSWDAFMTGVSEDKLLKKCDEFKEKNIPVKWAIIDDMWADVPGLERSVGVERKEMFSIMHKSRLRSFNADPVRFPNGLKECIHKINGYGIKVGMWHPTTGYWRGVTVDGEIMREHSHAFMLSGYYNAKTETYDRNDMIIHKPDYESAHTFYDAWHRYFKECGAEFVKVDNQSFTHRIYHDVMPLGEVAHSLHRAIEDSTTEHFDNALINCMGASAENMWHRPQSSVSRCSDDFQPENRDWFTKHILQCAYNCLVQGVFHVCDWDMWWTDDSQGIKNSVLRAISGGPIYVSDTLDRSRAEVLRPLAFDDGRILRTDRPATPINRCIMSDPEKSGEPFIIWSSVDEGAVVAMFDLDSENKAVKSTFSLKDVPTLKSGRYAVYDYFNKSAVILDRNDVIDIDLCDRDEFKLFTVVPIQDGIGFIGLTDKMTSARAIVGKDKNSVTLYQGGRVGFVSERPVTRVCVDGKEVTPERDGVLYTFNTTGKNITVE